MLPVFGYGERPLDHAHERQVVADLRIPQMAQIDPKREFTTVCYRTSRSFTKARWLCFTAE
jgi:hypothetical protein